MAEVNEIPRELVLAEEWQKRAKEIKTLDEFVAFWHELMDETEHDYGTICRAIGALAGAAANAANRAPCGGITWFQAGAVFWEFYRIWNPGLGSPDDPVRLLNYADMLYPQMEHKFRAINAETWEWIQTEAKKRISESHESAHEAVLAHWQTIADGVVPFGFYIER
jgi:hypothetical protein